MRRRGPLSARLRSEITATEASPDKDGFPCPPQVKPLLHFYKYLQPLPDGRKLQLNVPATVVCDKLQGREELLALRTDSSGSVVKEDKGPAWRKRLLCDLLGEDAQSAASLLSVGLDDVVAVRNVAHWKSVSGSGNSKSLVLTRRAFDHVVSAPCELAFSVQKYVRCRGSCASIFRVTWGERENRRFAINIFNERKISEASSALVSSNTTSADDPRPQGTPLDAALRQMSALSPYYLVTATSGADLKRQQQHAKLPRIRGNPIAEGLQAVKRIIDHFTAHLPAIKVRELTADFIKDSQGVWWFIRVMHFDAYYRIEVPQSLQNNVDVDSAATIHDMLRSKYFRQALRTVASTAPANCMIPQCSLCGCSCELSKVLQDELLGLGGAMPLRQSSDNVFRVLFEYRMTLKMVITTLFHLRQRGESLALWEHAVLVLINTPAGLASEFTVCYLCYRIYKSHLLLWRTALDLHEAYGIPRPNPLVKNAEPDSFTAQKGDCKSNHSHESVTLLVDKIHCFYNERCPALIQDEGSPTRPQAVLYEYAPIEGVDVDPTSLQMRFVFFFHELQDAGPSVSATDFYLEYHLGQHFARLDFDGSKRHTPNRWQLCEARVHYFLATRDAFGDYCSDKRLRVKLKSVKGSQYHGYTSVSFRPLISSTKWFGPAIQLESRVDYLLEIRTDAFGLLTLKMTLGLLVDPVPLNQVREQIKSETFLREGALAVYWPPPSFQSCSLTVPVDWIGALSPSEYVSVLPRRTRRADRRRVTIHRGSADQESLRKLLQDTKSPSQRFSVAPPTGDQSLEPTLGQLSTSGDGEEASVVQVGSVQRMLEAVSIVAKRVIYRVSGSVTTFPTLLLGHILSHARYLTPGRSIGRSASWSEPAVFQLTRRFTIDTLLRDIDIASSAALCVAGEILLVLVRCQMVSNTVNVATIERILFPFWLPGVARDELCFEPLPYRESTVPSRQRMVWNRAVRRCQSAHFCAELRAHTRISTKASDGHACHSSMTKFEELQQLRRRMSYRNKKQTQLLCEIFEMMETSDLGYVDIAELRSLYKCLPDLQDTPPDLAILADREILGLSDLEALNTALMWSNESALTSLIRNVMRSEDMQNALSRFDQFGAGALNFDEFWDLAECVMCQLEIVRDEPSTPGFCLRHGMTDTYRSDQCCVMCSYQYQDQEFLPHHTTSHGELLSSSQSEFSDTSSDISEGNELTEVEPRQLAENVSTFQELPHEGDGVHIVDGVHSIALDEASLVSTLQQLRAAEWHVRYRRESLDRAAIEQLITGRHSSLVESSRKSSSISNLSDKTHRKPTHSNLFSVTDFVAEAEQRKQQSGCLGGDNSRNPPQCLRLLRKPKKQAKQRRKKSSKSSALNSTRLRDSLSLSSLLQIELEDGHSHSRSTQLIDHVYRGETKRKKLDKMVLDELHDVKQRLARLLATS